MFSEKTYRDRRNKLKEQLGSGLLIFPGNDESPMNYPDNCYRFRQDSSFLYFWGLDSPGLTATLDIDNDTEVIYGNEPTVDDVMWSGPQPSLADRAEKVGVKKTEPPEQLATAIQKALLRKQTVHYLPQYRGKNIIELSEMLNIKAASLNDKASEKFIKAVVAQRSVKSEEELAEIEKALEITYDMHTFAMREVRPGKVEQEIAGAIEGIALAYGSSVSFPVIFSVHGETLHNHSYNNTMREGDILVCDTGAAALSHYAGDITRTIPVSGKFTERQKNIYQIVLEAQETAMEEIAPDVKFKETHLTSARKIAEGLNALGILQGDVEEAVSAGAHALFYPHGLGHMMGLDVHDMEGLGEDFVGYDEEVQRSDQFGLSGLRIGKRVQPGYVLTVEPGIYFIPDLIEKWRAEKKFEEFLNYDEIEAYLDFGGVRLEEDVVVTDDGYRVLGKPIPKSIADVEAMASS